MELYLSEYNYRKYRYRNASKRCKYKINNDKDIKDIKGKERKGIFDSNKIGNWYNAKLMQKKTMYGGNKR